MASKQVDALTEKTTPVAADLVSVFDIDSTSTEALKKVTIANLKAVVGGGLFSEDGSGNIVGGTGAGASLLAGALDNFFAGTNTATLMTLGDRNVGIGQDALATSIVGLNNTAIGFEALSRSTGHTNIAIGYQAGKAVTTGARNIALYGLRSSTASFIGSDNIAMQAMIGNALTSASYNVCLGNNSNLMTSSLDNVILGYAAFDAATSGGGNVVIGRRAGANIDTGDDNVIIGHDAGPTTNQSNRLYIHNAESDTPLIGGDFSTGLVTFNGAVRLKSFVKGALPSVIAGGVIYVSDATGSSLTGSMCFSNGAVWIDVTTGIAVA